MDRPFVNEMHIYEWFSPFINGLDKFINYKKFAPQLEQLYVTGAQCNAGRQKREDNGTDIVRLSPPAF